ncbi:MULTISPECIES: phosphatase PAP2 family protein [Caloramator]|uniref:Ser/Thr and Tyr protein phosphatase (Dual specificity) n=1 Tax=Caloramator australicus RC3 TaxID=857293 RepID=I7KTF7_9CLOT|nr:MULTISPECIES: phosphatase PAP2 family protein [Caloramator]MDO6353932.1 phosphatase PAP2 family protein [Caloramator sp. CAR-1]CCJ33033.1 Ser/Thr and Tyr protein phosphatase (dual specificity)\
MERIVEKVKTNYKEIALRLLFLLSIGGLTKIYVILNNYRGKVYHLKTALDTIIPFNKYFVVPYLYWYIYMAVVFVYFAVTDGKKYFKLLSGIIIGMALCFVIYYFFPTTVPRPLLKGDDIFIKAVNFIYKRDNPYNCFPSIHVLDSFLAAVYINREENISYKLKITSSVISFSIILSTLFIKQHYVYDALSAMVLAYIMYYSLNYAAIVEKIRQKTSIEINE